MFINSSEQPYKAPLHHIMFTWQRKAMIHFTVAATVLATLHHFGIITDQVKFPSFPLAVIGGALGIFISFRTNSAYQRWWEGRKLWGRMINTSRHICSQAIAYLPTAEAQEVVLRHVVYVHTLRCVLRSQKLHEDAHVLRTVDSDELEVLKVATNPTHALLNMQMKTFVKVRKAQEISEFHLSDFDESVRHLLDIQGGTERIKKTPFPPAYGFMASTLIKMYSWLLPLCLVHDLGWWVIPTSILICMSFQMINEVGRVLENPFEDIWPALALNAMSLTIERNLRQAIGEEELPPGEETFKVKSGYVLM